MIELRTYSVAEGEMGSFVSAWNASAVTVFNRYGIHIAGGWTSPESNEFLALIEYWNPEQLAEATRAAASVLRSVTRVEGRQLSPAMSDPQFARVVMEPDPALVRPQPARWSTIEVAPDQMALWVEFGHGPHQRLHHIDVKEERYTVRISLYLGLLPQFGSRTHFVPAIAMLGTALVLLERPLGGRAVVDGSKEPLPASQPGSSL